MSPSFYITTAIDYPNGKPHIGHAYEKVITDVYARWYRLLGRRVHFLTGTDENGQKLLKTAEAAGVATLSFVDEQVEGFRKLCRDLKISNDDFIRTTEPRHIEVVHELWRELKSRDQIYFGQYEGLYCLSCEAFYTDLQAPDGKCPVHGIDLESVKEDGYFFRLSAHADWIEKFIQDSPEFICPERSQKEILQRIRKEPIKDLSISRPNSGWGIPVPDHPEYVIYTWFDALINYIAAVKNSERYHDFWPADVHVIGKDIVWFHCVIWPCMLRAAEWPLPKQVYVHGMVLGPDGRKMSKSLGNVVDPNEMLSRFPVDSFRYYILRAIPSGQDGAFIPEDLMARHNNELANDFGNLMMRIVKLAKKKLTSEIQGKDLSPAFQYQELLSRISKAMDQREHHRALEYLWQAIQELNLYVTKKEPWKLEADSLELREVIYNSLYGLHCFSLIISAFLPETGERCLGILGQPSSDLSTAIEFGKQDFHLGEPEMLFPKLEG